VRLGQEAARRGLGAPRRRVVFLVCLLVPVSQSAWLAVTSTRPTGRIVNSVVAAVFAINALLWALTVRRATERLGERMTRLETQIGDRHAR
jgi:ABC-type transport system involved in cytochrome c biogenesis permease subunit